jgi:sulfoxide reductase heme-binding subunit YedZ
LAELGKSKNAEALPYLLAAVEVTSLLRRRIPKALWRRVHMLSFPLFVSATVHGLSAGTDSRVPMVAIGAALGSLAVSALVVLRLFNRGATGPRTASNRVPRPVTVGLGGDGAGPWTAPQARARRDPSPASRDLVGVR